MAPEAEVCEVCGTLIPSWAPAGNCPACLFDDSVETQEMPANLREVSREKIGDWELHERIGEGAFGVVYAAEQKKPVRRAAALKILRPGLASKELLARFEAESQALALMNHPEIVTIYDAGTTDDGRPFFAMEFVPGEPVTQFAAGLPISQKLVLFDRICDVVEHAHQRGIIHRDLKPANILAFRGESGKPVIKLLDFGIAKATEHVLTDATILTREGHYLGTPEYMSPEQTGEVDIDTRADVYSLGVILYELLVGHPPFVLDSNSLDAVVRFLDRVREESAPIPSSVAASQVAQDLDWIVGKAIEKDRDRRYQSVGELRDDLRRFRDDKPIEARPPDTIYLARKFLRRHRKLTATLAVVASTVIAASVISTVMAVKAGKAARETRMAYSKSDLQSGVSKLDQGNISHAIAHLVRSLRTDSANREAAMLLRSTLDQFPTSDLIFQSKLSKLILPASFITGPEGNPVVATELGEILFFGPDGTEIAPPIVLGGSNVKGGISSDEKLLAVANIQGKVGLVDLENHRFLPLDEPEDLTELHVSAIEFSLDSSHLVVAYIDGTVRLWDTSIGSLRWVKTLESTPQSVAFFNSGDRLAIACRSGERIDFDSISGERITDTVQQREPVHWLVPSGSGLRYYTVSSTGIIAACDPGWPPRTFTEQQVGVPLLLSAFDPARRLSAYLSAEEVSVWTVKGLTIIRRLALPDLPTAVALHPDKDEMFIGTSESGIHLWDFEKRQLFGAQISRAKHAEAIQIHPESRVLRCITRNGLLQHYQLPESPAETGNSQRLTENWASVTLENRNSYFVRSAGLDLRNLQDDPDSIPRAIGITKDGDRVFGVFRGGFIHIWDVNSGRLLKTIKTETSSVRCAEFSPDGSRLLFRDKFGRIGTHDFSTGARKQFDTQTRGGIASIAVAPTGDRFAVGTNGGQIRIYRIDTGEPLSDPLRHDTRGLVEGHFCRFSEDGKLLLSWGAADRAFRLWNPNTGEPVGIPIIDSGIPRFAQFHESGDFLITVTEREDKTLVHRIWSLEHSIPVTPEVSTSLEQFDFSNITLPDSAPFSANKLDQIESANGLKIGENGLIEVPAFESP